MATKYLRKIISEDLSAVSFSILFLDEDSSTIFPSEFYVGYRKK